MRSSTLVVFTGAMRWMFRIGGWFNTALSFPARVLGIESSSWILRYFLFTSIFLALLSPALVQIIHIEGVTFLERFDLSKSLGWMTLPWVPATSLSVGLLLVISINRAWAANEDDRLAIQKRLPRFEKRHPDDLPDLRDEVLASLIICIPMLPLWLIFLNEASCSYSSVGKCIYEQRSTDLWPWVSYAAENLRRGLIFFDFPEIYNWDDNDALTEKSTQARHIEFSIRAMIDLILISSVVQLLRIRKTSIDAVAALENTHISAAKVGKRAIGKLIRELKNGSEEDEPTGIPARILKNAATAVEEIGHPKAIYGLINTLEHKGAEVIKRSASALAVVASTGARTIPSKKQVALASQALFDAYKRETERSQPRVTVLGKLSMAMNEISEGSFEELSQREDLKGYTPDRLSALLSATAAV